jgi:6-oxo-cyclohex-1-ene-carbonyl-CoA hydrolase
VKNHNLTETFTPEEILYERRPVLDRAGEEVEGLHSVWITLNNPKELNAYTTEMVKEIILALREASNDRAALAVILTGAGTRAFCTGGNTREYDKPVICRVNGMRVGGGQELGMACDFSIASDLAVFSQAGPKHGSAPDGGSTDFLPLFVGIEAALYSGTLCEPWSAHRFYYLGGLTQIVPVLRVDGELVANPLVVTESLLDDYGRVILGDLKKGEERQRGKELLSRGEVDLALLDQTIDAMCTKLLYTMPDCLTKTIESLRKHKLWHWDKNRETNRAWLSLNMMTEANAGFRAFHHGTKKEREVDFVLLRQRLAGGARWGEELVQEIAPWVPRAGKSEK